jgi:hypothetical protein
VRSISERRCATARFRSRCQAPPRSSRGAQTTCGAYFAFASEQGLRGRSRASVLFTIVAWWLAFDRKSAGEYLYQRGVRSGVFEAALLADWGADTHAGAYQMGLPPARFCRKSLWTEKLRAPMSRYFSPEGWTVLLAHTSPSLFRHIHKAIYSNQGQLPLQAAHPSGQSGASQAS